MKQTKQSTGTVFFRAVVMIGFLGGIFYAALSGNALPDAVRNQIEKFLPKALVANKSAEPDKANASSGTKTSSVAKTSSESSFFNSTQEEKMPVKKSRENAPRMALSIPSTPNQLAIDQAASLLSAPSESSSSNGSMLKEPSPIMPVNYQEAEPLPRPTADASSGTAMKSLGNADAFSQIQERLKQQGATYYLLETWGNPQQVYRFYCKVAVGGNTNYTHCFEATGPDPLQTMADVLKQVEAWRNGDSVTR